jgi:hypothetical protein
VRSKVDVRFEDRGAQTVKNIAEPVRTYKVVLATDPPPPQPPASPGRQKPSMAFRFKI